MARIRFAEATLEVWSDQEDFDPDLRPQQFDAMVEDVEEAIFAGFTAINNRLKEIYPDADLSVSLDWE